MNDDNFLIHISIWIRMFFAVLGLIGASVGVGLYYAGFFHWLAKAIPQSAFIQYFFGA